MELVLKIIIIALGIAICTFVALITYKVRKRSTESGIMIKLSKIIMTKIEKIREIIL